MQSLKITTPITRNACFFFRRHRPKASEIDPREALELNLGQNFHHDDEMLMFSAGVDVDESALPRRKHYHCKSAFGATPVDRSGPSARLDFAPDRLASTWIAFFFSYCIAFVAFFQVIWFFLTNLKDFIQK